MSGREGCAVGLACSEEEGAHGGRLADAVRVYGRGYILEPRKTRINPNAVHNETTRMGEPASTWHASGPALLTVRSKGTGKHALYHISQVPRSRSRPAS